MKKLTAGIFSVLVGLCAADSAYAAIASEAWVDQVFVKNATYTTDKEGLESAIAKAQSDAETTAANALLAAKTELEDKITDEETARKSADDAINAKIGTVPAGSADVIAYINTKTSGIATDETVNALDGRVGAAEGKITTLEGKMTTAEGAIATLNGDANTTGSVAKSIADHIASLDLANTYDAKGAAAAAQAAAETDATSKANAAETNAKSYTDTKIGDLEDHETVNAFVKAEVKALDDGLGDFKTTAGEALGMATANAETIGELSENKLDKSDFDTFKTENTAAIAEAKSGAETTAAADATAKADAALTSAKGYTDAEIDKLETSLGTTSGDLTALAGRVTTAEGEINTLKGTVNDATKGVLANAQKAADNALNIATNAGAIADLETIVEDADKGVLANAAKAAANAAAITALDGRVGTAEGKITSLDTIVNDTQKGVLANAQKAADNAAAIQLNIGTLEQHTAAIKTINDSDVMNSGITSEKVSDYDTSVGVTTGIAALTTGSDGTFVLTAKVADGKITGYTWEDITRAGN